MAKNQTSEQTTQPNDSKAFFEQYWKHASALRNWFVVYGVGGIAMIFTKPELFNQIENKIKLRIAIFFLVAVFAQILLALLNKWIHWYIYAGAVDEEFRCTKRYEKAASLSERAWIDGVADLTSIVSFLYA
ncbi:MAG: hypothetical protein ACYST5_11240, partial [Planctomycetota bacterium]